MVDSAKLAIFFQKRITIHTMSRDFCRFSHIFADLVTLGFSHPLSSRQSPTVPSCV